MPVKTCCVIIEIIVRFSGHGFSHRQVSRINDVSKGDISKVLRRVRDTYCLNQGLRRHWLKTTIGPLTTYVKLQVAHAPGCFPCHWLQRKPLASVPIMHHGTYMTYVPWCMSGSLTRGGGQTVPGIPGACTTRNLRILARGPWKEDRVLICL